MEPAVAPTELAPLGPPLHQLPAVFFEAVGLDVQINSSGLWDEDERALCRIRSIMRNSLADQGLQ